MPQGWTLVQAAPPAASATAPDGWTPVSDIPPDLRADPRAKPPSAEDFTPQSSGWPAKIKDVAAGVLPTAGGIIGGIFGGIPGAAIGGAVGHGYKQVLENVTELPGAIKDVAHNLIEYPVETARGAVSGTNTGGLKTGEEAVMQAGGQFAGDKLAQGAGVMSKWLMNRATSRVSAKLMQDFPDLNETLIDNALTVSKGGWGKAHALLTAAKGKANTALRAADATGATVPLALNEDVAQSLKTALLEDAIKARRIPVTPNTPLTVASERLDPATKAIYSKIDAAIHPNATSNVLELSPSHADLLKRQLQKESKALYAQRGAPNGPKAIGMDATERAEYAAQLNDAIDGLASGYKAANAVARPLIGAERGIKQATRPSGNLYQAMVRPVVGAAIGGETGRREGGTAGAVLGGALGAYTTSPMGLSHEAIVLAHPAFQGLLRSLPKAAGDWLLSQLSTQADHRQSPEGDR